MPLQLRIDERLYLVAGAPALVGDDEDARPARGKTALAPAAQELFFLEPVEHPRHHRQGQARRRRDTTAHQCGAEAASARLQRQRDLNPHGLLEAHAREWPRRDLTEGT